MNNQTLAGAIGAGGLVLQIVLGFALSGSESSTGTALTFPHMLIGIGGIALVAFLLSSIFLMPTTTVVRSIYSLAFLLTVAQVVLGFRILAVADEMLVMAHQGTAFAILILLAAGGMLAARTRRKSAAKSASVPA